MLSILASQANAQGGCSVTYESFDLNIQCTGPSEDTIEVFAKIVASGGELARNLYVDIGDGQGTVNLGPAEELDRISIDTANKADVVWVHDVKTNICLNIATGGGNDKVTVGPNVEGDEFFFVGTSNGDDEIIMGLDVFVSGTIEVGARAGSDIVRTVAAPSMDVPGILAGFEALIYGSEGEPDEVDVMDIGEGSIRASRRVVLAEFESFGTVAVDE